MSLARRTPRGLQADLNRQPVAVLRTGGRFHSAWAARQEGAQDRPQDRRGAPNPDLPRRRGGSRTSAARTRDCGTWPACPAIWCSTWPGTSAARRSADRRGSSSLAGWSGTQTSRRPSAICTWTTESWLTRRTLSSRIMADGYSATWGRGEGRSFIGQLRADAGFTMRCTQQGTFFDIPPRGNPIME